MHHLKIKHSEELNRLHIRNVEKEEKDEEEGEFWGKEYDWIVSANISKKGRLDTIIGHKWSKSSYHP